MILPKPETTIEFLISSTFTVHRAGEISSVTASRSRLKARNTGQVYLDYKELIFVPIVFVFIAVFALLFYRRRRRKQRQLKAGVVRTLNPETGNYELRPLDRARVRPGVGNDGARPVVRRTESWDGQAPPPSYGEALEGGEVLPGYEGGNQNTSSDAATAGPRGSSERAENERTHALVDQSQGRR